MKKWSLLISVCLVALLLILFSSIPSQIKINRTITVQTNANATYRNLLEDKNWIKWWPNEKQKASEKELVYGNVHYSIEQKLFNGFAIGIRSDKTIIGSELNIVPIDKRTLTLVWHTKLPESNGPFDRIQKYFQSKKIIEQIDDLLEALKTYLDNEQNLYGSVIKEARVKDSVLVATRITTDHYPTTGEIYAMIDKLKAYVQQQKAKETDFPMLHVDSSRNEYHTMIAIPTDTLLNGNNNDIVLKRMVLGKILVTEVKGGVYTTRQAMKQLENYVYDYNYTSPAIPYESLVTDRRKEGDTAKWVTRLSYPVF